MIVLKYPLLYKLYLGLDDHLTRANSDYLDGITPASLCSIARPQRLINPAFPEVFNYPS